MMRLVIVILFIILIINFNDIIARRIQTNNIDFNCIKSLQEELNFDKNLHISLCKFVILESSPLISDGKSPIRFHVKIRAYTFDIELKLRKKHSPAFTYTSVLLEDVDKGEIKHTRTNISAITMSSQLTYYSDTQKNAAMIKFVENGLATMEGVIGNYVLRYIPKANYYILFRISFHPVPIYNENLNFYKVVDDVPSYDLKTTIGFVDIKLLVALDEYSISGRFINQVIKGSLIHFNAADMLFSKFTNPKITLSIIGIILPYATRNGIYNRTFNDNEVCNLRTTQIKESNEFFISKHSDYSFNSYHIGVVMTTLPICESESKNCEIYVSGYENYDCPHQHNSYSKTTIIRHPDFYGNYGAIVQNLKTRFIKYIARRYDKVGEILNPDEAFTAWSQNDVDDLTYYFRSQTARCWNEKLNVTPRPRNNARRSDRKENITNGQKWKSNPGVYGVQTNDVSNRTGISTIPLKEGRNEKKVNSPKDWTLKDLTKENGSRVTGHEHNTSLPLQKTDQSKIPSPVTEFTSARMTPKDYNNKGSEVLNKTVTVALGVKPYNITERPQKSTIKSPEKKNKAEIPSFNDYIPNDRNQTRNRSTNNRESANNIPLRKTDKSTTQTPVTESTKPRFTANDHKIIGSQKVNNTLTTVSREELNDLSEKPKESKARLPKAKIEVIMPSPNYLLSKDQIKLTNSTTSGLEQKTNPRLQRAEKSTNRAPLTESTTKRFTSNDHRNIHFQKVNNTATIVSELEIDDQSMKEEKSTIQSPTGKNREKIPSTETTISKDWIKATNSHATGHKPDTNRSSRGIYQSTTLASSEESPPARPTPQDYNIEGFKVLNETATAASEVKPDEMSKALETSTTPLPKRVTKAEDLTLKNSNPNVQNKTTNSRATGHEPATNHLSQGTLQSTAFASSTESTTARQRIRNKNIGGFNVLNKTTTVASGVETGDMTGTRETSTTPLPEKNTKAKDASLKNSGANVQNQTTNGSAAKYKFKANYSSQEIFQTTTLASLMEPTAVQLILHNNNVVGFNIQNETTKVAFGGGPENMSETPEESTTPLSKRKKKPEVSLSNDSNQNVRNKTTNISVNGRKSYTNNLPQDTLQSTTVAPSTIFTNRRLTTLKNNTVGVEVLKKTATSEVKPGAMSEALGTSTTPLAEEHTEAEDLSLKNSNPNSQKQTTNSNANNLEPADSHSSQEILQSTTLTSSMESNTERPTPQKNNTAGTKVLNGTATVASGVKPDKMSEPLGTSASPLPEENTKAKDFSRKNSNLNSHDQTTNSSASGHDLKVNYLPHKSLQSTTFASIVESITTQNRTRTNNSGGSNVINKTTAYIFKANPDEKLEALKISTPPLPEIQTKAQDLSLKNSNPNSEKQTTNSNTNSLKPADNHSSQGTLQSTTVASSTESTTARRTPIKNNTGGTNILNKATTAASEVKPDEMSEALKRTTIPLPEKNTKAKDPPLKNLNSNDQNQITYSSANVQEPVTNRSLRETVPSTTITLSTESTTTQHSTQNNNNEGTKVKSRTATNGSAVKPDEMLEALETSASSLPGKNTKAEDLSLKYLNINGQNQTKNSSAAGHKHNKNYSSQETLHSTILESSTAPTTTQHITPDNNNGSAKVLNRTATFGSKVKPDKMLDTLGTLASPLPDKYTESSNPSLIIPNLNGQDRTINSKGTGYKPVTNTSLRETLHSREFISSMESTTGKPPLHENNTEGAKVLNGTATFGSKVKPDEMLEAMGTSASLLPEDTTKANDPFLKNSNPDDQIQIKNSSANVHESVTHHSLQETLPSTTVTSLAKSTTTQHSTQDNNNGGTKVQHGTTTFGSELKPDEMLETLKTVTTPLPEKNTEATHPSLKNLNPNGQNQTRNSSATEHQLKVTYLPQETPHSTIFASSTASTTTQQSTHDNNIGGTMLLNGTARFASEVKPDEMSEALNTLTTPFPEKNTESNNPSIINPNPKSQDQTMNSSATGHKPAANNLLRETLDSQTLASSTESTTGRPSLHENNTKGTKVLNGTAAFESEVKPDEMSEALKTLTTPLPEENTEAKDPSLKNLNPNGQNQTRNSSATEHQLKVTYLPQETPHSTIFASSTASTTTQQSTHDNNIGGTMLLNGTARFASEVKPDEMSEALKTVTTPLPEKNTEATHPSLKNLNPNGQNQTRNSSATEHQLKVTYLPQETPHSTIFASSTASTTTQQSTHDNNIGGTMVLNGTARFASEVKPDEMSEALNTLTTPFPEKNTESNNPSIINPNPKSQDQTMNSSATGHKPAANNLLRETLDSQTLASSTESTTGRPSLHENNTKGTKVLNGTAAFESEVKPDEMSEALKTVTTPLPEKNTEATHPSLKNLNPNGQNQTRNSSATGHKSATNTSLRETSHSRAVTSSTVSTAGRPPLHKNNTESTKVLNGTATFESEVKPDEMSEALKTLTTPLPEENTEAKDPSLKIFNPDGQNQTRNSSATEHKLKVTYLPQETPYSTIFASSTASTTTQQPTHDCNHGGTKIQNRTVTFGSEVKPDEMLDALKTTAISLPETNTNAKDLFLKNSNSNGQYQTANGSATGHELNVNYLSQAIPHSTTFASPTEFTTTRQTLRNDNIEGFNVFHKISTFLSGVNPNDMSETLKESTIPSPEGINKPEISPLSDSNQNVRIQTTHGSPTVRKFNTNYLSRESFQPTTVASLTDSSTGRRTPQKNNTGSFNVPNGTATVESRVKPDEISETLELLPPPLSEEKTKPKNLYLKHSYRKVRYRATNSSATVHESATNYSAPETRQVMTLASSSESTTTRLKLQEHEIGDFKVLNETGLVESRVNPDQMSETLETSTTSLLQEQTKVEDPFSKNLNSSVQSQEKNSSATGRQPETNLLLSESNHSSIRASVTESATALFTANDHGIIGFHKENDTFTVTSEVDTNDMSSRPEKSTTLSSQSENNAKIPSIDDPILKDRTDVNNSHVTVRKPDINFSFRNTDESTSQVPVAEFTTPVFVNFSPEELEKLTDAPNPDNTSHKQLLFNPEISNGLESTVDTFPLVESTTDTLKSAAVADTSDSSAFILYASLSVPLLLSIVYSSYLLFNACRKIRRSR
ncbi:mucin-3A [Microplitis demolitor]|uniref:mucin-3A n=1 Tax=Microplitis demolitor TaxID=69319 RepID=UPI00235B60F7|nr:mucin-3A [Microplitis demolitor]XP_008551947.3 mucin-3A [Microplitis demolitor]XP_008551952.3 mucin-3A [Microplitis demolitor]XP_008551958.3 mucin-3A [Microplitis demolitor]